DGLVKGLYLVLQPSGAKSWAVRYRAADGRPRKYTIPGTYPAIDLKSARELAQSALVDVAKGGDPAAAKKAARAGAQAPSDRDLVEKVVDQFIERYAKANTKAETAAENKRILEREVVKLWRGRRLGDIGRADVHELLDAIVDRGSPVAANRILAALRRMCGWAVERGIIASSPCDNVKAPTAERSRDRVLTDDELQRLWTATDAIGWPFRDLVRLLLLTGQRRNEVGRMRWSEVDLDAALWTIPKERAKNGQAHAVPLSSPALAILRALPKVEGGKGFVDYVFTVTGKTPVSGYSNAKERLDKLMGPDTPGWVFHDLRRTAATGMARLGVLPHVVEAVLNHVSGSKAGVPGIYNRASYANEKRHALDAWGGFIERLTSGQGGNVVTMKAAS
ncbi:MAG: tyrosine-type recombinase/integrase, partial [Janthinobacterium lividum]